MKTSVVNFWNRSNVITQDKEAQLKYSYDQHVTHLLRMQSSRKILVDNSTPYVMKKRNLSLSKPVKERQFAIEQENGALIHKMLEVKKKGGEYSKDHLIKAVQTHSAPKSLFLPLKLSTEKKVFEENKVLDKDFEKSIKYKDNIVKRSRRIYNCFLMEGSFISGIGTNSGLNSISTSRLSKGRHSSMDEVGRNRRDQQGSFDESSHFLELPATKKGKKKQSNKAKQNSTVAEQAGEDEEQINNEKNTHQQEQDSQKAYKIQEQQQDQLKSKIENEHLENITQYERETVQNKQELEQGQG